MPQMTGWQTTQASRNGLLSSLRAPISFTKKPQTVVNMTSFP